jgi:hypothetical protein
MPCSLVDISDEQIVSIFRVEKLAKQETIMEQTLLAVCVMSFLLDILFNPENGGDMFL